MGVGSWLLYTLAANYVVGLTAARAAKEIDRNCIEQIGRAMIEAAQALINWAELWQCPSILRPER